MSSDKSSGQPTSGRFLKTRLTDLLGIEYPIIQCGMVFVSSVPMVTEVSNAGGLGILTTSEQTPEDLRQNIRKVRELTDKPFGVNLVPIIPRYRRFLEIVVEEKVPVLCHGLGNPFKILGDKPPGMIFMPTVGSVGQAIWMAKGGANAVIVHGAEGGGHPGYIGSTVLIPKAVSSLKIPVVASGGFSDGKGLVAALALGAHGVGLGSRFALSKESSLPENIKQMCLKANEEAPTISTSYDGFRFRSIKGEKIKGYRGWWSRPWELIPSALVFRDAYRLNNKELIKLLREMRAMKVPLLQMLCGYRMGRNTLVGGEEKKALIPCGQVVGRINDLPTCKEIMGQIVCEAEQIMRSMGERVDTN
jgi:NAD(P)H-dependent flavin oxidoreductase YrpB (nitropropane dioxygenase family)